MKYKCVICRKLGSLGWQSSIDMLKEITLKWLKRRDFQRCNGQGYIRREWIQTVNWISKLKELLRMLTSKITLTGTLA